MKRLVSLISLLYFVLDKNYAFAKPPMAQAKSYSPQYDKYEIVMIRHGDSEWNEKNLFTGWYDAKLSSKGKEEAVRAGKILKKANYQFDAAHISMLTRTEETLNIILKELGQENVCVFKTWRLNERHYGSLTGLNKAEVAAKYGANQVNIWRRSYDILPPVMETDHPYYKQIVEDPRYAKEPADYDFPIHESLKQTIERTLPYWNDVIVPQMIRRRRILIVAHGNSLRGIIKHVDNITDIGIMDVNIPTGIPFEYTLDENCLPLVSRNYLCDKETLKKAMSGFPPSPNQAN